MIGTVLHPTGRENPIIHVWITKYALSTGGATEEDVEQCSDRMVCDIGKRFTSYYHKPHWHLTKEEADARIVKMLDSKLKSLAKATKKIMAMRAQYP